MKNNLRRVKRLVRRLFMRLLLHSLQKLFLLSPWARKRISLGYATKNPRHMDGLGAQLQRVIAVRGLALFWGLSSWQPAIQRIAIHPLDGFESKPQVSLYLKQVNELIDGKQLEEGQKIIYREELRFFQMLKVLLKASFVSKQVVVTVSLPFNFVDSNPQIYSLGASQYRSRMKNHLAVNEIPNIAIHHRWGVGNTSIQPGQKISRSVDLERFRNLIENQFGDSLFQEITIFTDAPPNSMKFTPGKDYEESWKSTAGFSPQGISILGQSEDEFNQIFPGATVIRGGNPLETLARISAAKKLVLSNSSFGYVAALLSIDSEIFLPQEFWHPALSNWKSF